MNYETTIDANSAHELNTFSGADAATPSSRRKWVLGAVAVVLLVVGTWWAMKGGSAAGDDAGAAGCLHDCPKGGFVGIGAGMAEPDFLGLIAWKQGNQPFSQRRGWSAGG